MIILIYISYLKKRLHTFSTIYEKSDRLYISTLLNYLPKLSYSPDLNTVTPFSLIKKTQILKTDIIYRIIYRSIPTIHRLKPTDYTSVTDLRPQLNWLTTDQEIYYKSLTLLHTILNTTSSTVVSWTMPTILANEWCD